MIIENSTIVVTGAGRGIGFALVRAALAAGAGVVYAGVRNREQIAALEALDPHRVKPLLVDVADPAAVARAAETAADAAIVINNAGVLYPGDPLTGSLEAFETTFATNFYGVLHVARAFAPVIEKNGGGALVNVGSLMSLAAMPALTAYSASKAALWSLTQSLRATLAPRGISVSCVFPGLVDTDMARSFDLAKANADDVAAAIIAGLRADKSEILPDPMAISVYDAWRGDHKSVEKQFAALI